MGGCAIPKSWQVEKSNEVVQIAYAMPVPLIDGKLNDPIWITAPVYRLVLSADISNDKKIADAGSFQAAYDDSFLYVAARFEDSDVGAMGKENGLHHYLMGDVAELFLWPEDQTYYWELYATPKSMTTAFFFPSPGRLRMQCHFEDTFQFPVAASVEGTLNDWSDHDKVWIVEMAIPVKELVKYGATWGPGSNWRMLLSRYNYSRWLDKPELSGYPCLPKTDFHLRNSYAIIKFQKSEK
jgi:hypothetical protein